MRRNLGQGIQGVEKTKEVKIAIEAIEMDETVKNKFKDVRLARAKNNVKKWKITMDPYYGLISAKMQETVGSVEKEQLCNCGA